MKEPSRHGAQEVGFLGAVMKSPLAQLPVESQLADDLAQPVTNLLPNHLYGECLEIPCRNHVDVGGRIKLDFEIKSFGLEKVEPASGRGLVVKIVRLNPHSRGKRVMEVFNGGMKGF